MNIFTRHLGVLLASALLLSTVSQRSFAGSATWNSAPISNNWNTAENWIPATIPNGPSDIANFGPTILPEVNVASSVEVSGIQFMSGAPSFTISVQGIGINLLITGNGIANSSGNTQSFTDGPQSAIFFFNNANAGETTFFGGEANLFFFLDWSSAGGGTFSVTSSTMGQGSILFFDDSTAADASIAVSNFAIASFGDTSTAANAVFTAVNGGDIAFGTNSTASNAEVTLAAGGGTEFTQSATAAQGNFTVNGASSSGGAAGFVNLSDSTTAGDATFVINGGSAAGAPGAEITFFGHASAGEAFLTANGGSGGGEGGAIFFQGKTTGGTANLSVFGNGQLDLSEHGPTLLTMGSLQGDGLVFLGGSALGVGSNNTSTTFSGLIQDGGVGGGTGGSLSKVGSGTLTLSGANTYTGTTTVSGGTLKLINRTGSATGSGAVNVNSGTLGGPGTIAGPVTVGTGSGTGAFLAPATGGKKQATLTLQSGLTLNSDATYTCTFKARKNQARTDLVLANGITLNNATLALSGQTQGRLRPGLTLTLLNNTSASPISGTFNNLPQDAIVDVNGNHFQASYTAGDGNDFTLTVVP